jgi:hypothetical protein
MKKILLATIVASLFASCTPPIQPSQRMGNRVEDTDGYRGDTPKVNHTNYNDYNAFSRRGQYDAQGRRTGGFGWW